MVQTERSDVDGSLVPANGYILVTVPETKSPLIVVGDAGFKSAVVMSISADDTDDTSPTMEENDFDWKPGDLIYYIDSIEVDGETLVHWTDVVAYRRFK